MNMGMGFGFRMSHSAGLTLEQRLEIAHQVGGVALKIMDELGLPARGFEAVTKATINPVRDVTMRSWR